MRRHSILALLVLAAVAVSQPANVSLQPALEVGPHQAYSAPFGLPTFDPMNPLSILTTPHSLLSASFSQIAFLRLSSLSSSSEGHATESSDATIKTAPYYDCNTLNNGIISENTTLDADFNSNGTCFTLSADNVTLDCNNHTVYGLGNAGILVNNRDYVSIRNCNLVGFDYGVYILNSDYANVQDNIIHANLFDVYFNNSNHYTLSGNIACFVYGNSSGNGCDVSLEFTGPFEYNVTREFVSLRVGVKNTGNYQASAYADLDPIIDIPISFIGAGEKSNPVPVGVGETRNFTIGLTLSDAQELNYSFPIRIHWRGLTMDSKTVSINLPSWDRYNLTISLGEAAETFSIASSTQPLLWNISMPDISNASSICMNSKQTVTVTNTGLEPVSDLSVQTVGNLNLYLDKRVESFRLEPGQSISFNAYAIVDNETPQVNGGVEVSGARLERNVQVDYNPPAGGGEWAQCRNISTDSYVTIPVHQFVCVNKPTFCVTIALPSDLDLDSISEARMRMGFSSSCGGIQEHDMDVSLNGVIVQSWEDSVQTGEYDFPFSAELLDYDNQVCGVTWDYQGRGHWCANVYTSITVRLRTYRTYCEDKTCNKTEDHETVFNDDLDSDCDGFKDCQDLDSCGSPQCPQNLWCQTEDCDNGLDDDGNGLVDWEDTISCPGNCNDTIQNRDEEAPDCGGRCPPCWTITTTTTTTTTTTIPQPNLKITPQDITIKVKQ
ncbi:MAG: hypothetical protein V1921_08100 [Candidatus Altiarchaeota archaeon]